MLSELFLYHINLWILNSSYAFLVAYYAVTYYTLSCSSKWYRGVTKRFLYFVIADLEFNFSPSSSFFFQNILNIFSRLYLYHLLWFLPRFNFFTTVHIYQGVRWDLNFIFIRIRELLYICDSRKMQIEANVVQQFLGNYIYGSFSVILNWHISRWWWHLLAFQSRVWKLYFIASTT